MTKSIWHRRWLVPLLPVVGAAAAMLGSVGLCVGFPCVATGVPYGVWLEQCPASDLRLQASVSVDGLVRGAPGVVSVRPQLQFLAGAGRTARTETRRMQRGAKVELVLLDSDEKDVPGLTTSEWEWKEGELVADLTLPDAPDGDYQLRAQIVTPFETALVEVDLPLYKPAVAHLMTDRPLYKPGQDVLLRSLLLEQRELTPLEGRPGRWRIESPDGQAMMVERARSGSFGVADTSFPLDTHASLGTWSATWSSGDASDTVKFEVRPFQLPRFTVELAPSQRWFGGGDTLQIDGIARYTSGAPVREAEVSVSVRRAEGRWPAPIAWEDAFDTRTDTRGSFSVELGEVPADLVGHNTYTVTARVSEDAGETVLGATQVVLSKDDLSVEAVTELGDGLVGGFNNRAYLRVSTPDGTPLPLAEISLTNPWDPSATTRTANTDEDGVVAFQLDPGEPVTVVIEPPPLRVRPLVPEAPRIVVGKELLSGAPLSLRDRRALDEIEDRVARCGDFALGDSVVKAGVFVTNTGAVRRVVADQGPLQQCVANALSRPRFGSGAERTFEIGWSVPDSLLPKLVVTVRSAHGRREPVDEVLQRAALLARPCLPRGTGTEGAVVLQGHWGVSEGSRSVTLALSERTGTGLSRVTLACVRRAYTGVRLEEAAQTDALGTVRLSLSVPRPPGQTIPKALTKTGYDLQVAASRDGAEIGATRLVLDTGTLPPLRLRATPSLASAGDTVVVEMLRGPQFSGDVPRKLKLMKGNVRIAQADRSASNQFSFTIPDDAEGFLHTAYAGARTVIYVQPRARLAVELATDKAVYRPGESAALTVNTRAGDQPIAAGVGLVGLDSALGQLAPLLGPEEYGRVTVRVEAERPAFGAFDPRALTLGQISGENAAKAAVMRISQLPDDAAGDRRLHASEQVAPDVVQAMTTAFYAVLERAVQDVRAWEGGAPPGEVMTPQRMVSVWRSALEALDKEPDPPRDAYGRRLTLDPLPSDLLEQVDPRQVVADGTRLPEDVVSWTRYVEQEVRR